MGVILTTYCTSPGMILQVLLDCSFCPVQDSPPPRSKTPEPLPPSDDELRQVFSAFSAFFLPKNWVVKQLNGFFFEFHNSIDLGRWSNFIRFFSNGLVQPPTSLGWSQVEFPSLLKSCSSHAVSDDLVFCLESLNAMETYLAGLKTWGPNPQSQILTSVVTSRDVTW